MEEDKEKTVGNEIEEETMNASEELLSMDFSFFGRNQKPMRISTKTAYQFNRDQQEYDFVCYMIIKYVQ